MSLSKLLSTLVATWLSLLALPAHADLKVVATVPDLAALARAVGGEHVQVKCLSLSTQDPHFVDARPHLALDLNQADLLLAVGLELEVGWLPALQQNARNSRILTGSPGYMEVAPLVKLLEVPTTRVDRSQGDVHPGGNPHFLYDPRSGLAVARGIAARMSDLDPSHAALYQKNLERFAAELEQARARWEQRLAGLKGQPILAFHRTTAYLSDWLGFRTVAYLEPKPGIPPNPSHVAQVIILGRQVRARLVLQEEYYSNQATPLVAQKVNAPMVLLPGGADFRNGETYLQNLEELVTRLEQALAGKGS